MFKTPEGAADCEIGL